MDFWDARREIMLREGFGTQRLILSSKASIISQNRPNSSLAAIQEKAKTVNPGEAAFQKYQEIGTRYLFAKDLTFDLFISIYDVNSFSGLVLRATMPLDRQALSTLRTQTSKLKNPNLEMRAIGMQNNDTSLMSVLDAVHGACNCKLIELDLFGNESRHVALDFKTGLSYDILLLNRIYRPGEKAITLTRDQFLKSTSKLKFV